MSAPRLPLMLVAFLLVAGLGLAWLLAREAPVLTSSSERSAPLAAPVARPSPLDQAPDLARGEAQPATTGYINAFHRVRDSGGDLYQLARASLPRAQAGDAEAMWTLTSALGFCLFHLQEMGDPEKLLRFTDMARQVGGDAAAVLAVAEEQEAMCAGFRSADVQDLGTVAAWYAAAVEAGQPSARIMHASQVARMWRNHLAPDARFSLPADWQDAVVQPTSDGSERLAYQHITEQGLDAVAVEELRVAAIRDGFATGRADVVMDLHALLPLDRGSGLPDSFRVDDAALNLVACSLGMACGADAPWVRNMERQQPVAARAPRDGRTLILETAPRHLVERIIQRAAEIEAYIAAGAAAEPVQ